jgi:Tol biopolymer transport system component
VIARRSSLVLIALVALLALPAAASATPPGANGRIVFSSTRFPDSNAELYSVAADGTSLVQLTENLTHEQHPTWSPDGSQIAFGSDAEGNESIHVMNADGTLEHRVSPDGVSNDSEPAWSPDGSQIAFASTRPANGDWHVWVMNADGSALRQVTGEFSTAPAWSPDGTRLAFARADGAIGVVNTDGSGLHQLTSPPAGYTDERASWSPDGIKLVFPRRQTNENDPQLYVIDADGTDEHQLTSTPYPSRFPSWSPDGTQIVFTHFTQVSVINADGSGIRPLLGEIWGAALTPDWGTSTTIPPPVAGGPTIQIYSPEARFYPYGVGQEIAFYSCDSATSFVVSCEGDVPSGSFIDTSTVGTHTFTVRATDLLGRTTTKSVNYEVFDWQTPTLNVRAPADGTEYEVGESVEVEYECVDEAGGSGIEICDGELQDGQPLDTSTVGSFTAHFWAVDRAHNVTQHEVTYSVARAADVTPPTITIATPQEGAVYVLGQTVLASYSCEDATSCTGAVASGALLDTSTVGPRTFTVSARDASGNVANTSRNYRVIYPFSDFAWPASPKAGDSVLFRFSLGGDRGPAVVTGATWSRVDCQNGAPLGDASTATGKLSYQNGRYKFLVTTSSSWNGSCRQLGLTLADGTTHLATVTFH